ncbi:hypothetical protein M2480_001917 [Parabacteroides sp. PFB2-12]|uniref:O-antigen ligase domain-containing protein n=1 Tax=unclassified Parabacteroides TaxID=2649774 RepID=UPI0024762021|nr:MULTISPECIES: O-antigen ligase domain-containing protein [unclassified Parabacteroides]MDH6343470.1 hypothetical protein [Parabacteroides sp. PM6-13]MDH6390930.1 hypothetical protein [Parabacteroides sp. PFB2-12]
MLQKFIDKNFFYLFTFTLIFGVIFYDLIRFSYTDEICTLLLFVLFCYKVVKTPNWEFNKLFLFVLGVFLFYLIYSFAIGSNSKKAIVLDFILQLKPYIGFFCVYALAPRLSQGQKVIIRQLVFLFTLYLLAIGLTYLVYPKIIDFTLGHESRLATAVSILAMLYLYCTDYTPKDKFVFIMILLVGILSGRSKFYGFCALSTLMVLFINNSFQMKFTLKNSIIFAIILAATIYVAYDKINFYFIQGGIGTGKEETDLYARIALYYFSVPLLLKYIPFGSGFATYGTHASSEYYSKIYEEFGMDRLYGLSKNADPNFISDTYYPALAQFGFVGVFLFFWFWLYLVKQAIKGFLAGYKKEAVAACLIIFFFLIECTSDSTITHNRGLFMMMLLGLIFGDMKNGEKSQKEFKE